MDPFDDNNELQVDPTKNYFEELVGEGKKFQDAAALARAKVESDNFIKRLQQETAGLREELKTRTTVDEFVNKLKNSEGQQNPAQDPPAGNEDTKRSTSPEEIEALIEQTLTKRQTQVQKENNYRQTVNAINEAFGTDAPSIVKAKANELGMSLQQLKEIAETNPKAFLRLVEADNPPTREADLFAPPPRSTTSVPSAQTSNTNMKNNSFYEKMRLSDPNKYWSPQVQNEIHLQAQRLGEKFFT